MDTSSYYKIVYWALRVVVLMFGLLFAALACYTLYRIAFLFASGGKLSQADLLNIPKNLLLLFCALFLLAPHRWFLRTPLFVGKMLVYSAFLLFAFYRFAKAVFDLVTGRTIEGYETTEPASTPLDIMLILVFFMLPALLAPLTLFLKRRLSET